MNKEQWTLRIRLGLMGSILAIGLYIGGLKFQIGKDNLSSSLAPQEWVDHLSGLESVTGTLFINPGSYKSYTNLLLSNHQRLWMEMYDITKKDFYQTLQTLAQGGVDVHIIMENKKYMQYQDTFGAVKKYLSGFTNAQVQSDYGMKTQYVHAKMLLGDSGFIIQTANLTHSSFFANREYIFTSNNSGILKSLETIFQKDWNHETITLKDIHPNLLICNINCRAVIEHLITSAQISIEIQNQYLQDDRLESLLKEKSAQLGTDHVRAMFADAGGRTWAQQMSKPYLHAKMMLIDKKVLLLGSMNFSTNSLDNNREIGILINDPSVIRKFQRQFEEDWK